MAIVDSFLFLIFAIDIDYRFASIAIHSAFAAAPPKKRGILFIQLQKSFFYFVKIITIHLTETAGKPPMVNGANLMKANKHIFPRMFLCEHTSSLCVVVLSSELQEKMYGITFLISERDEKTICFPFISDPTFSPKLTHHKSRSFTSGDFASILCNFSLTVTHSKNRLIILLIIKFLKIFFHFHILKK